VSILQTDKEHNIIYICFCVERWNWECNFFCEGECGWGNSFAAVLRQREQVSLFAQVSNLELLLSFLAVMNACLLAHNRANIERTNFRKGMVPEYCIRRRKTDWCRMFVGQWQKCGCMVSFIPENCLSFASENSLLWNRFCHLQQFLKPARFSFNSASSLGCSYIFVDNFSGLGRAISKMYVCVCHLNQMTFDVGIWHAVSSRSNSKVKVYSHRKKVTLSAMDVRYEVTFCRWTLRRDVFWLYVQFFWLKWSVRPRVRAF